MWLSLELTYTNRQTCVVLPSTLQVIAVCCGSAVVVEALRYLHSSSHCARSVLNYLNNQIKEQQHLNAVLSPFLLSDAVHKHEVCIPFLLIGDLSL